MTETYTKPPVKEIVCQLRFSLTEENPWTTKKAGDLLKVLGDEYPNFENPQNVGIGIHIKEGSIAPELLSPKQRLIYSKDEKTLSVMITPESFSFICKVGKNNEYKSWDESFLPSFKGAWNKVKECLSVKEVKSVGTRYINHIDKAYGIELHEALDSESEYLPKAVIAKHLGFFNRSEVAIDSENTMIIQAGIAHNPDDKNDKIIILDIDRIVEKVIKSSEGELLPELEKVQKSVEKVFFSSISDRLKEKMK